MRPNEVDVDSDPEWTLKEWKDKIEELIELYGEESVMYTDGGHNNVDLVVKKAVYGVG